MTTPIKRLTPILAVASAMALGLPAFAQDSTAPAPETAPPAAPDAAAPDGTMTETMPAPAETAPAEAPMTTPEAVGSFMVPEGYSAVSDWNGITAEQLKGVTLYSGEGDNIGNITDIHLGTDGAIDGIITDVGGFLGIGAHTVSLGTDQVSLYRNEGGTLIAHTSLNAEALKALPEYVAPQ